MRNLTLLLLLAAGCSYTPAFSDLTCETEGATRDGQRCEGGVWVVDTSATNNGGADTGGGADASQDPDMGGTDPDMAGCSAESDAVFCQRLGLDCGPVNDRDNCGAPRTAECGTCAADVEECSANVCELVPETDEELCAALAATCGVLDTTDRTGAARQPDCGECVAPLECGADGTANACSCPEADNVAFCASQAANCGPVTALDPVCGVERTVNCGTCTAPESCGGGETDNVCGCMESDDAFCTRLGANCGLLSGTDLCGLPREDVDCGGCADPMKCGDGGTPNVCGCDAANICAGQNAECGILDVTGQCDNINTADCGGCGVAGACNNNTYVCECENGYAYNGMICADIDECANDTDNCDANATCTNSDGSFVCTCDPPYTGDGTSCAVGLPTIAEMVSDTQPGTLAGSTLTTGTMTAVDDDLYVAFVSVRGDNTATGVNGLGLTWTSLDDHCSADNDHKLSVWTARGNASSDSAITVSVPVSWVSAVVVYRVTNVPTSGAVGSFVTYNSRGQDATCSNPRSESSYSFSYTSAYQRSLMLVGTTMNDANHSPGSGWTEDEELHRTVSGRDTSLATMHRDGGGDITVDGSFSSSENWISIAVEVRGL